MNIRSARLQSAPATLNVPPIKAKQPKTHFHRRSVPVTMAEAEGAKRVCAH